MSKYTPVVWRYRLTYCQLWVCLLDDPRFTAGRSRELSDKRGNPSLELMIIALTAVEI